MQPISPVLTEEFVPSEVVFGANQPEYIPLPALRSADGMTFSRWRPTDEEREAIAAGADVYLTIFGKPFKPVMLEVISCAADMAEVIERMGLA